MTTQRRRRRQGLPLLLLSAALTVGACSAADASPEGDPDCPSPGIVSGEAPWSPGATWQQIYFDDFDRCSLGNDWSTYSGSPGGNPVGEWDPSMVSIGDGILTLNGRLVNGEWLTGGVSNFPVTQKYGRWEVRMRAQPSADLSYHMLLWPQNEEWPPEIDFAESVFPNREALSAFIHWRDADGGNAKASTSIQGDFDDWHTVGVEWLPGTVRYLLDGEVWAETTDADRIPHTPMWLGMQVEAGSCERREQWGMNPCGPTEPRPTEAAIEIDWVVVYRPGDDLYEQADEDLFEPNLDAQQLEEH